MLGPSARERTHRLAATGVVGVVALILLAGIGSAASAQVATLGSPAPEVDRSPVPAEVLDEQDAMLAYADCMRGNGVEVTDPAFDAAGNLVGGFEFGDGKDTTPKDAKGGDFLAASEACNGFLVAFKPTLDPALQTEQTEAALRFAVCMREQGLEWPDPLPDGTKFAGAEIKIDKKSAEFQAAFEVCDDELANDTAGVAAE